MSHINILVTGSNGQDGKIIFATRHLWPNISFFGISSTLSDEQLNIFYMDPSISRSERVYFVSKLLIRCQITHILHLAASNFPFASKQNYNKSVLKSSIIDFTEDIVNACLSTSRNIRIVHSGSVHQYSPQSQSDVTYISSTSPFNPQNLYGEYKSVASNIIKSYSCNSSINSVTAILFNHNSRYRSFPPLITRLITAIGRDLGLLSNTDLLMADFIADNSLMNSKHVLLFANDVVFCLIKLLLSDIQDIYIVGMNESISFPMLSLKLYQLFEEYTHLSFETDFKNRLCLFNPSPRQPLLLSLDIPHFYHGSYWNLDSHLSRQFYDICPTVLLPNE